MAQTRILRVFAASLLPTQGTRGRIAARAHPRAPSKPYPLPSSPFSLLWKPTAKCPRTTFSFLLPSPYSGCPLQSVHALPSPFFSLLPTFVSISGSIIIPFVYFVFFVVPPLPPPTQRTRGGTAARARPSAPSTHYLLLSSPFSSFSQLYAFISFYKNLAVTLSGARFTSSREPRATIRPPASPPPGPMSMM